jgi:succinylglutamate desuccinylase
MPSQNGLNPQRSRGQSQETTRVVESPAEKTEDVLIRNYDHRRGYDLHLVVTDGDETAFQNRYYLQPGETVSECDLLPSADYEITVTLDTTQETSRHFRIDSSPDHTAVVEIGNGALSLTEGLYS